MAKYLWGTLCTRAVVDQFRNSVSIHDIIEEVRVPDDIPALDANGNGYLLAGEMTVFSYWERSDLEAPERAKGRFVLIAPTGATVASTEFDIDLAKGRRSRMLGVLPGLPFVSEGRYTFRVEQQKGGRWLKAGDIQYDVIRGLRQVPAQPVTPEP
jgi:hypothetical protein